ncbi:MAG: 2-octaprenyl-6-methoxyphenyl hydroxylase [Hyphomicrobiales bacterium]|nr:ubiquinone biosynthesis hydroxylase [Hyphomicrobiales bacterium]PCJ94307.1 MAG: 2-octaprenyl-6-methoxyphenyl hydroxylase [Hyphomicrobiales bacterium]
MARKTTTTSKSQNNIFDVVIAGAGYAGLAMALALKSALPSLRVAIADPRDPRAPSNDQRASAIAASGRNLFTALGVWDDMVVDAQPIEEMIVTDSQTGNAVRPVFLTFEGETESGEPFAHMVPNQTMVRILAQRGEELGLEFFCPDRVTHFTLDEPFQTLKLASGVELKTKLLIAADGVRSALRNLAGIQTVGWSYGQSAIVCTIAHSEPHHGKAWEHFLPAGPFAILPLPGNRSSLVWSEKDADAQRLVNGDEFTFRMELERRIGNELGDLSLDSPRQCFPLGLKIARDFVRPRFALLGDAAHGIHPIAGQGLNLGLRDVAALSEVIVEAARLGQDFGQLDVLQNYERWRRADTVQMAILTDILNRMFSNDIAPVRLARTIGLGLVDRMPGLKKMFIGEAAGSKDQPRLLQGLAL